MSERSTTETATEESQTESTALAKVELEKKIVTTAPEGSNAEQEPAAEEIKAEEIKAEEPSAPEPDENELPEGYQPRYTGSMKKPMVFGMLTILFFFFGFGAWLALTPLDSAVMASGRVSVEGHRKAVQHRDGGPVKKILVRDGDLVKQGQPLIQLDASELVAKEEIFTGKANKMLVRQARLLSERRGHKSIQLPPKLQQAVESGPEIAEMLEGEQQLFDARMASYLSEVAILKQSIRDLQEQIKGYSIQKTGQRNQRHIINKELSNIEKLADEGYIRQSRIYQLQRNLAFLDSQNGELIASVARARESINKSKLHLSKLDKARTEEIADQLQAIQQELNDLLPQLRTVREQLKRTEILAPEEGRVLNMVVHGPGSVIKPGETILEVVPADSGMIIEAKVLTQDIEDVREQMDAKIMLSAFSMRVLPNIFGKVTHVSADSLTDQATGMPYYLTKVAILPEELEKLKRKELLLYPGMPAEVIIPTGERTALDYLVAPIYDNLSRAFLEK
uniref:Membrane fusion protein (MFP) family protein n=1 Tax=Magnetococcus massalia (strain MO-1) TaxID=451514 RepID=A0A1S7LKI9_MAGMO|nr:putative protease secretion protein, AprE/HlyD homologue. Type I secretion inner membrane component [Candidatus Magnetococcus massalia]